MTNAQLSLTEKTDRLHYLDSLRGLMAVNVLICHFVCVYYPQMYFPDHAMQSSGFLRLFATTPLSVTVNGNIAVVYFMVLTGFLAGMSVFAKKLHGAGQFVKKSLSRYTRILPVVLVATLFTYVLMKLRLMKHMSIADSMVNTPFVQSYCNFVPDFKSLIFNIFINPFIVTSDYVGPFWCIKYELWGYIAALLLAMTLKNSRCRRLLYAVAIVLIVMFFPYGEMYYACFVMGLFIADIRYNQNPTLFSKYDRSFLQSKLCIAVCCIAGLYFACCTMFLTPLYSWWFSGLPQVNHSVLRGLGMAMLMYVFTQTKVIQKVLEWKPFQLLGKCSFEIYAIHWPVMLSLEAFLFITFRETMPYDFAALAALGITLVVIGIAAFLLHFSVEKCSRGLRSLFSRY